MRLIFLWLMVIVLTGVVWLGERNAREFEKWQELRLMVVNDVRSTERLTVVAEARYGMCVEGFYVTSPDCYQEKLTLEEAQDNEMRARRQFERLSPMPDIYFGGYFLRH